MCVCVHAGASLFWYSKSVRAKCAIAVRANRHTLLKVSQEYTQKASMPAHTQTHTHRRWVSWDCSVKVHRGLPHRAEKLLRTKEKRTHRVSHGGSRHVYQESPKESVTREASIASFLILSVSRCQLAVIIRLFRHLGFPPDTLKQPEFKN